VNRVSGLSVSFISLLLMLKK